MELTVILAGIQAAIAAAPKVVAVVKAAKDMISGLVAGGVITTAQQAKLHGDVDAIAEAFANGQTPPAWQVEADPV